jgi:DNA mismatch repair protein MutS
VERRVLKEIISPGTYLSYETEGGTSAATSNNLMCIWIERQPETRFSKKRTVYAAAVIDIFTGKSAVFEYETAETQISTTSVDELERFITIHSPVEVILLHSLTSQEKNAVLQYAGIRTDKIHSLDIPEIQGRDPVAHEKIANAGKQNYIKHLLESRFGVDTYAICAEFHTYSLATQAFCYLLNFLQEHNPNLIDRIGIPAFQNTDGAVTLANHTLKQLNILDDSSADGKRAGMLSSVFSLVNKCCTAMGRRKLYMQITHPIYCEEALRREYDITALLLEKAEWGIDFIRRSLTSIRDIERFCRNLLVGKLTPSAIYQLHQNLNGIQQTNECFAEQPLLCAYFCRDISTVGSQSMDPYHYIRQTSIGISNYMESKWRMDVCKNVASSGSEDWFIAAGVCPEYDSLVLTHRREMEKLNTVHAYLNALMQRASGGAQAEYIKIHETEKSGLSLQITKKRAGVLKPIFAELVKTGSAKCPFSTGALSEEWIQFADARIVAATGSVEEIEFRELTTILRTIQTTKEAIATRQTRIFAETLADFAKTWYRELEHLASYVATMDTLQSKAYVAKTYRYCKPEMDGAAPKSFVSVEGLRHCLIEHLNTAETYVANDLTIGRAEESETDGVLLYGTNAVGKTSFIRALGIAVILAQSGFYVPCTRFLYKPYTAIYSRILGNDNIFKGLSTFAVEMSELRLILKMADQNSLILGDELCSGTETESALAIFMSGLMQLHSVGASFLFATHFHEILRFDEMAEMPRVKAMHMAVEYHREMDCLVYDRRLRPGAGNRMYGLEVCQSLHLPVDFLDRAYSLRNKYYPDTRGALSAPVSATYHSGKVRGMCEMCGVRLSTETHHLSPQRDADEAGFIGTIHKNHPGNLAAICEKCHQAEHSAAAPTEVAKKKRKTTRGKMVIE